MELIKLINDLESFLYGNEYGIPFILRDKQNIADLADMLRELLTRRRLDEAEEGIEADNSTLPEPYIGKATVQKKLFETECVTYSDAIRNIEYMVNEYNKSVREHKDKGFPKLLLETERENSDYGGVFVKHRLEVRMPVK